MKNSHPPSGLSSPRSIRKAFDRLAYGFDGHDALSLEASQRLIDHSREIRISPARVGNLGCGYGEINAELKSRFPGSQIIALDLSDQQLRHTDNKGNALCIQGDSRKLPLADQSLNLIFSNLLLPWISQPKDWLTEVKRVAEPGCLVLFSTLGPDSFSDLRMLWKSQGVEVPNPFPDMHGLGNLLLQSDLIDPVLESDRIRLRYQHLPKMFNELKAAGAGIWPSHRRPGLTGKARMNAFFKACEQYRQSGRFNLQVELILGHAWIGPSRDSHADPPSNRPVPVKYFPGKIA